MDPLPVAGPMPPFALFEGIAPSVVRDTLDTLPRRVLNEGDRLPECDPENASIYLLVSGCVGVFIDAQARLALATIGPGETAGELPALKGGTSAVVLTALEPTQVLDLPMARLHVLMQAAPRIALNLLGTLGPRLRQDRAALRSGLEHRASFEASALADSLTGLLNRRAMNDLFDREIQRAVRGGVPAALLMIGIDHLGKVNDSVGHAAGDRALVALATAMRHVFRPGDLLARYEGATFCALLSEASADAAREAAGRLRTWIAAHPVAAARDLRLSYSVSVGVAGWTPEDDLKTLAARAASALETAQREGHNRVSVSSAAAAHAA